MAQKWLPSPVMSTLWQDVRYGMRRIGSSPIFAIVAIISLALGIGANTAVFSLVNTVLLRPFPVADPGSLVALHVLGRQDSLQAFSYPAYVDFRDRNQVLSGLHVTRMVAVSLSKEGNNQRVWGYLVSANYFDVLGVKPFLGRMLTPEDDKTRLGSPVAVITHASWQTRFGRDPNIIGKTVLLNGHKFEIVGVAPPRFIGTDIIYTPEVWMPMSMLAWVEPGSTWLDNRGTQNIFATGRLKPGVSLKEAQASLNLLSDQLGKEYPDYNEGQRIVLTAPGLIIPTLRGAVIAFTWVTLATVAMVLLIACTNLASLLLARASERRKEIAIRLAIGAGRFRLIRQLLTESLLLSIAGGILGVFLAQWILDLVAAVRPPLNVPIMIDLVIDFRVLIFALFVSVMTGLIFGIVPALQATKGDLAGSLKTEATIGGFRRSRLRDALIVAQLALSLLLLIAAGLVVRALQQVRSLNPGFNPDGAMMMSMDLNLQGYDNKHGLAFTRQMLDRTRALPGIESAAVTTLVPLSLNYDANPVLIEGEAELRGANAPTAMNAQITNEYFKTMEIPILAGRSFDQTDTPDSEKTAIVNETFAHRFLKVDTLEKAIGRRTRSGSQDPWTRIVGVVGDGKYFSIGESPQPFIYVPLEQSYYGGGSLIFRTRERPETALKMVRDEINKLDATLPLYDLKTLNEHMGISLFPARVAASLLGAFGMLALLLAAIGIYGVTSYAVAQRTREIGIRMALGADRRNLITMIVKHGAVLSALGLVIGVGAALAATRMMAAILYGVSSTDISTFVAVSILLTTVAIVSSFIPALRASRVDPVTALRYE